MSDGPIDYGSGYFFQSQKGISDRRAAQGFPAGPGDADRGGGSIGRGDVAGGGGSLIATLLFGLLFFVWKVLEVVVPILLTVVWEAAKLAGQMLLAVFSSSKSR